MAARVSSSDSWMTRFWGEVTSSRKTRSPTSARESDAQLGPMGTKVSSSLSPHRSMPTVSPTSISGSPSHIEGRSPQLPVSGSHEPPVHRDSAAVRPRASQMIVALRSSLHSRLPGSQTQSTHAPASQYASRARQSWRASMPATHETRLSPSQRGVSPHSTGGPESRSTPLSGSTSASPLPVPESLTLASTPGSPPRRPSSGLMMEEHPSARSAASADGKPRQVMRKR
ncbi:MAG TPA: hypothetical protein DEF51_48570 [Myxococcales bacterium]|nr:hypothetical protein [Myxococcales bacterium]